MTAFFLILSFLFLILFPATAFEGAKNGLLLWFQIILPTLFPFLVVTNLMEQLLPLRSGKLYTIATGMLSGYPVGAKSCTSMMGAKKLTKKEGQYLLSFCNNASPAFLLNYVFVQCLGAESKRFILLFIIYLSAFLSAQLIRPRKAAPIEDGSKDLSLNEMGTPLSFDNTIMSSFEIITKIGGYVILFSLLANIIQVHTTFPSPVKILLCGILEITTGVRILSESMLSGPVKLVLGLFIASFGGLSALFQTSSVIKDSSLSLRTYASLKAVHSLLCVALAFLLLRMGII